MKIETRTTGFSSPASDYAAERLALCDEHNPDPFFTFYFRSGLDLEDLDLRKGDIVEVSRRRDPKIEDWCVGVCQGEFVVQRFCHDSHWGVITSIIPGL